MLGIIFAIAVAIGTLAPMAVTGKLYGLWLKLILDGTRSTDWDTDTIKVMLTTSTYTPNQDTNDHKDDVTNEVVGTGYTAGGATLASKTVTYTGATNVLALDAADVTWSTSTITARNAVVYKDSGVASTSPVICYQSSDADLSSSGGNFTIQWHADGIVKITVS